jgi:hypothetical protein
LAADNVEERTIRSQPSWVIANKQTELAVTRLGGHMAPVKFFRDSDKPLQPYYISPWQDEKPEKLGAPVLAPLRGDFFCLPFGGNTDASGGEEHPPHGEIAGSPWTLVGAKTAGDVTTLTLSINTKVRKGRVTKELSLVDGQSVVYARHTIEGFAGPAPLGHHATLAMPAEEGAVRLAASKFRFGMTYPGVFSDPKQGEYQSLLPGARWTDLGKVPVAFKDAADADLTRLPARFGYADLVLLANEPWEKTGGPAWMTATFPDAGYVWFSLKDPDVLRTTVFWIENHGRHGSPWNGRNNCLGLEDITGMFADGLAGSTKPNVLTQAGVKTAVDLSADKPTSINYIQGVARVPKDFPIVRDIQFAPGKITLISPRGQNVEVPVRHEFLKTGQLSSAEKR